MSEYLHQASMADYPINIFCQPKTVDSRTNNPYQYFPYVNKHANMFFVAYYVYLIHMDHPYFSVLNKLKNNCNNIRDLCYSISLSHVKNKSQSNNYWCEN